MTITSFSGHTLHVAPISIDALPKELRELSYAQYYEVRNFDKDGCVFMYLGKGDPKAPREIVAWYPKTLANWHSFGTSIKSAIEGAQRDGWLYA
jgi:hypothetical protein